MILIKNVQFANELCTVQGSFFLFCTALYKYLLKKLCERKPKISERISIVISKPRDIIEKIK